MKRSIRLILLGFFCFIFVGCTKENSPEIQESDVSKTAVYLLSPEREQEEDRTEIKRILGTQYDNVQITSDWGEAIRKFKADSLYLLIIDVSAVDQVDTGTLNLMLQNRQVSIASIDILSDDLADLLGVAPDNDLYELEDNYTYGMFFIVYRHHSNSPVFTDTLETWVGEIEFQQEIEWANQKRD